MALELKYMPRAWAGGNTAFLGEAYRWYWDYISQMEGRLLFQVAVKDVMLPGGDEPLQRPGTLHQCPVLWVLMWGWESLLAISVLAGIRLPILAKWKLTVLKAQANTKSIVKTGLWRHCKPWRLQWVGICMASSCPSLIATLWDVLVF